MWTCYQELVKVTCKTQFKQVEEEQISLREQSLRQQLHDAQLKCEEAESRYALLRQKMDSLEQKFSDSAEAQL